MSSTYRIAHFSDFHLRDTGIELNRATRLFRDAISQGIDHIVLTGDIVDAAQVEVIGKLWGRLRRLGWSSGAKMTFAPGNHDIFPVTKRWPFVNISRPTGNFRQVCNITGSCRRGKNVEELGNPFPVGKVLSESVVIAALDTTRNGQYMPTRWSEGELSAEHRDAMREFLDQHKDKAHRIVAMHHTPFDIFQSEDNRFNMNFMVPPPKAVREWLLACGATLVLCGHVHCETTRKKIGRKCWVLQAGTAGGVDEEAPPEKASRSYHIIECSPHGRVSFMKRQFIGSELD